MRQLKLYLISKYGQEKVLECFTKIHQIFLKSLLAVQKSMIYDKHCFELYGYDVLIDSNLKPWLLEVNAAPSMTANTQNDFELKCNLLDDVFTIIDMERVLQGNEEQIGGFDLIYRQTPLSMPTNSIYTTYLGCYNQRSTNLKKLAKISAQRIMATPEPKAKIQ